MTGNEAGNTEYKVFLTNESRLNSWQSPEDHFRWKLSSERNYSDNFEPMLITEPWSPSWVDSFLKFSRLRFTWFLRIWNTKNKSYWLSFSPEKKAASILLSRSGCPTPNQSRICLLKTLTEQYILSKIWWTRQMRTNKSTT